MKCERCGLHTSEFFEEFMKYNAAYHTGDRVMVLCKTCYAEWPKAEQRAQERFEDECRVRSKELEEFKAHPDNATAWANVVAIKAEQDRLIREKRWPLTLNSVDLANACLYAQIVSAILGGLVSLVVALLINPGNAVKALIVILGIIGGWLLPRRLLAIRSERYENAMADIRRRKAEAEALTPIGKW